MLQAVRNMCKPPSKKPPAAKSATVEIAKIKPAVKAAVKQPAAKTPPGKGAAGAPKLRGLHMAQSLRNVYIACGLSVAMGLAFFLFNNVPKHRRYAKFYADYEPEEVFDLMMKRGFLSSCPPPKETTK